MVAWQRFRELALELPEVEETTSWRERLADAWLLVAPKRLAAAHPELAG